MNRIIILTGREKDSDHYTLLVRENFTALELPSDSDTSEIIDRFAGVISNETGPFKVELFDGYRLENGDIETTLLLNNKWFERGLILKISNLIQGRGLSVPGARYAEPN
jgi:hypothetical protein